MLLLAVAVLNAVAPPLVLVSAVPAAGEPFVLRFRVPQQGCGRQELARLDVIFMPFVFPVPITLADGEPRFGVLDTHALD